MALQYFYSMVSDSHYTAAFFLLHQQPELLAAPQLLGHPLVGRKSNHGRWYASD